MKRLSKRTMLVVFGIWLVLTAISLTLGLAVFNPSESYHLAKVGVRASGRVTALEPENHQIVRYAYVVNGQQYTGVGRAGHGNPMFEDLKVSQEVMIHYDPAKPQSSSLGYPQARLSTNLWAAVMVAIVLPLFLVFALIRSGLLV
jgi:hypothetical protein